jgi:hypothetical protein
MTSDRFDFVTVVYEAEHPLLHLQGRSFARYLDSATANRLVIIDNSRPRMRSRNTVALLREYGCAGSPVEVVTPKDLEITVDTWGDRGQQALKLAIADRIDTPRYVVLDAKNHLIAPLNGDWLEAPDGRLRRRVHSYVGHPREHGLRAVLAYFGLDQSLIESFTASTTPFVMETATVRDLMRYVEERHATDFASAFVASEMTEFPLYTAWVMKGGCTIEQTYALDEPVLPALWPHMANGEGVRQVLELAGEHTPFFSVHREALARLDSEGADILAAFWASRGLFVDSHAGAQFIAAYKRYHRRVALNRKLRRAPGKMREVSRARVGGLGGSSDPT